MIEALISMAAVVGFFVLLPLILLGAAFKLLFALVLLPFRLIGAVFHVVGAVLGGIFAALASVAGVLGFLLIGVVLLVALPLLPLLLLGGFVWAVAKAFSGKAAVTSA
jgi:hypothetical protein